MIDPKYKIESQDFEKFGIRQSHTITRIDVHGHRRALKVFFGYDGKSRANKLLETLEKNDTMGDDSKLRAHERKIYFWAGIIAGAVAMLAGCIIVQLVA